MKKWTIFPVLFLLLLTACQTVPANEKEPAGSIPPSSSITPPSSSVVPPASSVPPTSVPTTSIPATSVPATNPPEPANTGYAHIYGGNNPFMGLDPDFSECTVGYLYWIDIATSAVTPILEEAVLNNVQEGAYVYYVKEAEPSKIYRTLIGAFSQHEWIHETAHGKVGDMTIYPGIENYLQFVADNKKFVVLEFDTGEETVLMEQCYIDSAHISGTNGILDNGIWFRGKHTENDHPYEQFYYDRDTGETREDTSL